MYANASNNIPSYTHIQFIRGMKSPPPRARTSKTKVKLTLVHTRAKSHDHDIERAQKKVPKGRANTPPKSCSVVTDPPV